MALCGCGFCWPAEADAAWAAMQRLPSGRELVDDWHFGACSFACEACGQDFVRVFSEQVDWADGDDPQYVTVIPLEPWEVAALPTTGRGGEALVAHLAPLVADRVALHRASPKGEPSQVFWRKGLGVI